jgi:hypothetical protein
MEPLGGLLDAHDGTWNSALIFVPYKYISTAPVKRNLFMRRLLLLAVPLAVELLDLLELLWSSLPSATGDPRLEKTCFQELGCRVASAICFTSGMKCR